MRVEERHALDCRCRSPYFRGRRKRKSFRRFVGAGLDQFPAVLAAVLADRKPTIAAVAERSLSLAPEEQTFLSGACPILVFSFISPQFVQYLAVLASITSKITRDDKPEEIERIDAPSSRQCTSTVIKI